MRFGPPIFGSLGQARSLCVTGLFVFASLHVGFVLFGFACFAAALCCFVLLYFARLICFACPRLALLALLWLAPLPWFALRCFALLACFVLHRIA